MQTGKIAPRLGSAAYDSWTRPPVGRKGGRPLSVASRRWTIQFNLIQIASIHPAARELRQVHRWVWVLLPFVNRASASASVVVRGVGRALLNERSSSIKKNYKKMHKLVWTTRGMHQNILKRHGGLQRIRQWAFGDLARRRNLELEDGITKEQLSSSKTDDWPKFWLPAGIFSNMYECPQGVLMSTTLKRKAIVFMLIWSNSNRFLIHIQGNCLSGEKTVSIIFRVTLICFLMSYFLVTLGDALMSIPSPWSFS
jgi:hypothetical protein